MGSCPERRALIAEGRPLACAEIGTAGSSRRTSPERRGRAGVSSCPVIWIAEDPRNVLRPVRVRGDPPGPFLASFPSYFCVAPRKDGAGQGEQLPGYMGAKHGRPCGMQRETCSRRFESGSAYHVGLAGAGKPANQPDRLFQRPPFAMGHGMSAEPRNRSGHGVAPGSCVGENPTFQENELPRPFGPRNDKTRETDCHGPRAALAMTMKKRGEHSAQMVRLQRSAGSDDQHQRKKRGRGQGRSRGALGLRRGKDRVHGAHALLRRAAPLVGSKRRAAPQLIKRAVSDRL